MAKRRKIFASLVMLAVFVCTTFFTMYASQKQTISALAQNAYFRALSKEEADKINALATPKYGNTVQKLTGEAQRQEYVTLIAVLDEPTIADALGEEAVSEKIGSAAYNDAAARIKRAQDEYLRALKKSGISYEVENRYDTVLSGLSVRIKTRDFDAAEAEIVARGGQAVISETYAVPKTVQSSAGSYQTAEAKEGVTENKVDVQETGIFNSAGSQYDGTGTIVAVLDSGFDYTHSVYQKLLDDATVAKSQAAIAAALPSTNAIKTTPNMTVQDVYYSNKIPFMYDYADFDADVYPLESEHGTHVAAIIAGDDSEYAVVRDAQGNETVLDYKVRGVAPGAQLALMKVFSDVDAGAKQSHILAAVEDCVHLGVDAINMSLGMSAGFAREVDKVYTNEVYDKVREAGISLICAASNDYNSTYGSEANGNLPLTSNPDSATVGTPSTYDSAISVASISGVKTPYIEFEGSPIYYFEASNSAGKPYNFMEMLLGSRTSGTFSYVKIPGVGALGSYTGLDMAGKIALVRRGQNTFEEKVQAAGAAGAAGIIIYNNVSGDIRMNVGNYLYQLNNGKGVACISMSQDDGERLAAKGTGTIRLDKTNLAGPFMSDFSSWGPLPDLGIKPEITAHGGDILSAVPGQKYDRLSGTSMASPNQCGVHTLVRQYVKDTYHLTGKALARRVNQLLMSTANIAHDELGNPYSIRKQGAGLANLTEATTTRSFIGVKEYAENGAALAEENGEPRYKSTTKIELGDDPDRTGEYTLKFSVINQTNTASSYTVDALVFSEGVSKTLTDKDETTSDQHAYMFRDATHSDASIAVSATSASGTTPVVGNSITVNANATLDVTVTITLSQTAKNYLDKSFEFGMYVEGFVTLTATDGGVDLRAPYLAFYGDWAEAPIFDLTYFETNPDELNDAIDTEDKIKPDAWATRPIAGVNKDYIAYMGGYYFVQNPSDTPIPAQEEHIALSNGTREDVTRGDTDGLNYIYSIWAGLLRGCKSVDVSITEQVTGKEIWHKTESNVRKSYSYGSGIIYANVDMDFYPSEHNLKNNTKYVVTLTGHLDYKNDGTGENHKNTKNTYSFVFTTDFSAPQLTDVRYYTEYDEDTKSTRAYAELSIFDNHYLQAVRAIVWNGKVIEKEYNTPVYGGENTTNIVTIELTDYLSYVAQSTDSLNFSNGNTLTLFTYDYAMNRAIYELRVPDDIKKIFFAQKDYKISINQTVRLTPELYPTEAYAWGLEYDYVSGGSDIARVVDDTLIGLKRGTTKIAVRAKRDPSVSQILNVTVLGPSDDGYRRYDEPTVRDFSLTGYRTDYAHYARYSDELSIGSKDTTTIFDKSASIKMYPGEVVTVFGNLKAYFPERTSVKYVVRNGRYAQIAQSGNNVKITALEEGTTLVTATVYMTDEDGEEVATMYSASVAIEVLDPYISNGPYLTTYKGAGGRVEIPAEKNFTQISQFAFSFAYSVDRDPSERTEEDPYYTKNAPKGDERLNKITEIKIPEGVEVIDQYAFAKLTALKLVELPRSLRQINAGAFEGCTSLETVVNLDYVQIISKDAFKGCKNLKYTNNIGEKRFELTAAIGIGMGAFEGCGFKSVTLPKVQSAAAGAFKGCTSLATVTLGSRIKLASGVFEGCTALKTISVNAPVIPDNAFSDCTALTTITLGPDVEEVGTAAFAKTRVSFFTVDKNNQYLEAQGGLLLRKNGNEIVTVAPGISLSSGAYIVPQNITSIGSGAFSHVSNLESITFENGNGVAVGEYAFYGLSKLTSVTGSVTRVQKGAFQNTALTALPTLAASVTEIGDYAFAGTKLTSASLGANITRIGAHAFDSTYLYDMSGALLLDKGRPIKAAVPLTTLTISGAAAIGDYAFVGCARLASVTLSSEVTIGDYAFYNCAFLGTLNGSAHITSLGAYALSGDRAENAPCLTEIDLSKVTAIGEGALRYVKLKGVTVPKAKVAIGAYAFAESDAIVFEGAFAADTTVGAHAFEDSELADFTAFAAVTEIGDYAFAGTQITKANLAGKTVGVGAFQDCLLLEEVTLPEKVADYTFASDEALSTAKGMRSVKEIGEMAFLGTAIESADLSGATKIGRLAFAVSALTSVTLGEDLKVLGDNPFAGTGIPDFTKTGEPDKFGIAPELRTFDISENVKVIDGALYAALGGGKLELITLPVASGAQFTVAEGTVRISDFAAAFNLPLTVVYLPYTLQSIGHAAFYGSNALSVVSFGSVEAPILEAEYDYDYADTFVFGSYNVTSRPASDFLCSSPYIGDYLPEENTVWYNNNFKDYIGYAKGLTMVYPENGTGYDSLLYKAYFRYETVGATVAEAATRAVIALIQALPNPVTLDDEVAVNAARMAYDRLSLSQRALVHNYETLTRAEQRIATLKNKETPPTTDEPPTPVKSDKNGKVTALAVVVVLLTVAVLALAAVLTLLLLKKKGEGTEPQKAEPTKPQAEESEEQAEGKAEEPAEQAEEKVEEQAKPQSEAAEEAPKAEEAAEEKPAAPKKGRKKAAKPVESEKEPDEQ